MIYDLNVKLKKYIIYDLKVKKILNFVIYDLKNYFFFLDYLFTI